MQKQFKKNLKREISSKTTTTSTKNTILQFLFSKILSIKKALDDANEYENTKSTLPETNGIGQNGSENRSSIDNNNGINDAPVNTNSTAKSSTEEAGAGINNNKKEELYDVPVGEFPNLPHIQKHT